MPRKYIPIPEDQKKKRGPKPKETTAPSPEEKLFFNPDPVNDTPQAPEPIAQATPEPTPEPIAQATPEPEPTPEPTPTPEPNRIISSDVPTDLDAIISDYSASGNPTSEPTSSQDHVKDLHGTPAPTQTSTAPKISLVRGYMILLVLDFVLPMGITFLLKKTSNPKFKNITARDIKLTDDEFDDLEPVADEVAKDIQLNLSPMTQLFLGMSIIYGGKILTLEK